MDPQKAFFKNLFKRQFSECEKIIGDLRKRYHGQKNRGYIHALEGMLTSKRDKDPRAYINRLIVDPKGLDKKRKEFKHKSTADGLLTTLFDEGYFTAWHDCIVWLLKEAESPSEKTTPQNGP